MEEQQKIYLALLEIVRRHHYTKPDYQPDTVNVIIYNVCPLCGSINLVDSHPPNEGESAGITISRLVEACKNCLQVQFLHPQIFIWVKQVIDNRNFEKRLVTENIETPFEVKDDSKEIIH